MKLSYLAVVAIAGAFFASTANAVIIAADDFESYSAGVQLHTLNGGSGWTTAWDVGTAARQPEVTVQASGLSYSGGDIVVNGGANAVQYVGSEAGINNALVDRSFGTQAGNGPVYLSFLYQQSVENGDADFMQFGLDTNSDNPSASVLDRNGEYQIRSTTGVAGSIGTGVTSNEGETSLLVLRLEKTGGSSTYNLLDLYVNPTSLDEFSNASTQSTLDSGLDLSGSANFVLRKAFQEAGDTFLFDEIRVTDSFKDAIHLVIPEPTTAVLGLMGIGGLVARRRRVA